MCVFVEGRRRGDSSWKQHPKRINLSIKYCDMELLKILCLSNYFFKPIETLYEENLDIDAEDTSANSIVSGLAFSFDFQMFG